MSQAELERLRAEVGSLERALKLARHHRDRYADIVAELGETVVPLESCDVCQEGWREGSTDLDNCDGCGGLICRHCPTCRCVTDRC